MKNKSRQTAKKRLPHLCDNLFNTGEAGIEPALTVLETAFLPLEDSPISFYDANTHPQNRTYKSNLLQIVGVHSLSLRDNFVSSDSQMCVRSTVRLSMQAWPSVRSRVLPAFLSTWSSLRPISSSQLHTLLHFHPCPINLVVFKGTYLL